MRQALWFFAWLTAATVPAMAQEAREAAPGPLSVEGGLVVWTLVVFGLLLAILGRSAWPVLLQTVRDRERELERRLAEAAKAQEDAARLLEEHKKLLAGAKGQAQALLAEAKSVAQQEREAVLKKAREEHKQM